MIQSSGARRVLARNEYRCDVLISQITPPSWSIHLPIAANLGPLISHNWLANAPQFPYPEVYLTYQAYPVWSISARQINYNGKDSQD